MYRFIDNINESIESFRNLFFDELPHHDDKQISTLKTDFSESNLNFIFLLSTFEQFGTFTYTECKIEQKTG